MSLYENEIYELYYNDMQLYWDTNFNNVAHELLGYNKIFNLDCNNLLIKKKLNSIKKIFPIYYDIIKYNNSLNKFLSVNNSSEYKYDLFTIQNINNNKIINNNVPILKNMTKIKGNDLNTPVKTVNINLDNNFLTNNTKNENS